MTDSQSNAVPHHVPVALHAKNRQRLLALLRENNFDNDGVVLFKGGDEPMKYDTDLELTFRQEGYFYHLFGVQEPDAYALIHVGSGKSVLFSKKMPAEYAIWMPVFDAAHYQKKYEVDESLYTEDIESYLENSKPSVIYTLNGVNSDSGVRTTEVPSFPFLEKYKVDNSETLHDLHSRVRRVKTEEEIAVMRYACQGTSQGHIEVMKHCKPGLYEYQLEATFAQKVMRDFGMRYPSYTPICGSGRNSATLHYITNEAVVDEVGFVLCDMGYCYYGYQSDITCTFPSTGKFSDKQKVVYQAALNAKEVVGANAKAGVLWSDMQKLADKEILKVLASAGIVKGDIDEMVEKRVGGVFFPHGLGHFLGIETHDVGGYLKNDPERPTGLGIKSIRTNVILEENMVITNEPGCYFIPLSLENAKKNPDVAPFINFEEAEKYIPLGGVRLEDNIVIKADGTESLNYVPRSIAQVEACMAGEDWTTVQQFLYYPLPS